MNENHALFRPRTDLPLRWLSSFVTIRGCRGTTSTATSTATASSTRSISSTSSRCCASLLTGAGFLPVHCVQQSRTSARPGMGIHGGGSTMSTRTSGAARIAATHRFIRNGMCSDTRVEIRTLRNDWTLECRRSSTYSSPVNMSTQSLGEHSTCDPLKVTASSGFCRRMCEGCDMCAEHAVPTCLFANWTVTSELLPTSTTAGWRGLIVAGLKSSGATHRQLFVRARQPTLLHTRSAYIERNTAAWHSRRLGPRRKTLLGEPDRYGQVVARRWK